MSLIGSIVERTLASGDDASYKTPFPVSADPKTGFPAVTHRSQRQRKSAFRQNMEAARPHSARNAPIPVVGATGADDGWRSMMEAENQRRVANMTAEERDESLRMIRSKFGDMSELADILNRARDIRAGTDNKRPTSPAVEEVSDEDAKTPSRLAATSDPSPPPPPLHDPPAHRVVAPARPILSRRSSVCGPGGSRAGTPGVRFAEVTPQDVYSYPSAPGSPKRQALMIEAPPAEGSGEGVTKIQWHGKPMGGTTVEEQALSEPVDEAKAQSAKPEVPNEPSPEVDEQATPTLASTNITPEFESQPETTSESTTEPEPKAHPLSQVVNASPPSDASPKRSPSPPALKLTLPSPTSSTFQQSNPIAFPSLSPSFPSSPASLMSNISANPSGSPISLDLEPDTPEAIRAQYFPDEPEPKDVLSLQWMVDVDLPEIPDAEGDVDTPIATSSEDSANETNTPVTSDEGPSDIEKALTDPEKESLRVHLDEQDSTRFNLAGTPIPRDKAKDLPVHDGLHHNSRSNAGYTLAELLHLARSTAPMQRAMALDALARLAIRVGRGDREVCAWFPKTRTRKKISATAAELRRLVVETAVGAIGERGAVGTRAVDCLYAALVVWDSKLARVDCELSLRSGSDSHPPLVSGEIGTAEMDVVEDLPLGLILDHTTKQLKNRALPRSVLTRLLAIVVRLARHSRSHASAVMDTPQLVPEIIRAFVLSRSGSQDALAIRLLVILARSSRQIASALLDPTDALLRFVAVLPSEDEPLDMLLATLDLYSVLGTYGMYAHIATTASSSFDTFGKYVRTRKDPRLLRSWVNLLAVWIACATDPHHTTPAHEILWSQVEGWGWGSYLLSLSHEAVTPDAWNAISVWLEGASVNGIRGGEAERAQAGEVLRGGQVKEVVRASVSRLEELFGLETLDIQAMDGAAADADVLCAALRLDLALRQPGVDTGASSPLDIPLYNISSLVRLVARHRVWDLVYKDMTISPYAYTRLASLAHSLGCFLLLARRTGLLDGTDWLQLAFITLQRLPPSCAETAARIISEIGAVARQCPEYNEIVHHLRPELWNALLPFLLHNLHPEPDTIVSPRLPSFTALPSGATQILPSRPNLRSKHYGLPTRNDWTFSPLSHLLRSGTSPVFKALPSDWDVDEVDVVRTTLALASVQQSTSPDALSGAEVVFGCMRIFMLEHDQPHDDSSAEVFRDNYVENMMRRLLAPISLGSRSANQIEPAPLEAASSDHLSGQPFYQFYTDLVGLYDAVSFAHPIFCRVLLPPLSMNYAVDYRRLVWGDYGHILRSIQTELADVPSASLKEWLWPRETDGEMIGWYLKALMKGGVTGFLRFVAVHHLAASIWPDLNDSDTSSKDMERTKMIMSALVHQAGPALFGAVVLYDQGHELIATYPECWEGGRLDRERRGKRLEWAVSLCGERVRGRLEHVLHS